MSFFCMCIQVTIDISNKNHVVTVILPVNGTSILIGVIRMFGSFTNSTAYVGVNVVINYCLELNINMTEGIQ